MERFEAFKGAVIFELDKSFWGELFYT